MTTLQEIANRANSDIAWLAASHLVYKTAQQGVLQPAKAALTWPEQMLLVTPAFGTPEAVRSHWESLVGYFKDFRSCAGDAPTDDPGHYLNKVAVVYAVAILEGFLQDAFFAKYGTKLQGSSLARQVEYIQGKPLFGASAGNEVRPRAVYIPDFENCAHHALFLGALRNAIVHNRGFVNDFFLRDVGYQPNQAKTEVWDHGIWRTRANFKQDYTKTEVDCSGKKVRRQICLDVAKVVIPYMHRALCFVRDATQLIDNAPTPA